MTLEFSGAPEIAATREEVWARLMDPHFVARSAPGIESVQVVDSDHFTMVSSFGIGALKVRFTLDAERFDVVERESAAMRMHGTGPGSTVEVVSNVRLEDAGPGRVRLHWTARTEVSGAVASVGTRLMEGTARSLTEQFWNDFAARVAR